MKIIRLVLFVAISFLFVACGEKAAEAPSVDIQAQAEQIQKIKEDAQKEVAQAQIRTKEAENAKEDSQNLAWGLGIVAIVALLIGVAIGSSARKDAKTRKTTDE